MNTKALVHLNRQPRAPVTALFLEFILFAHAPIIVQRLHNGLETRILQEKSIVLIVIPSR